MQDLKRNQDARSEKQDGKKQEKTSSKSLCKEWTFQYFFPVLLLILLLPASFFSSKQSL
jgi:hypothetical protein